MLFSSQSSINFNEIDKNIEIDYILKICYNIITKKYVFIKKQGENI